MAWGLTAGACLPGIELARPRDALSQPRRACVPLRARAAPPRWTPGPAGDAASFALDGAWGDDRPGHALTARWSLALGADRQVTGGDDRRVVVWDTASGRPLSAIQLDAQPASALLAADGATLVVATDDHALVALDVADVHRGVRWRVRVPPAPCHGIAFASDPRYVTAAPSPRCVATAPLPWRVDVARGELVGAAMYALPALDAADTTVPARTRLAGTVRALAIASTERVAARVLVTDAISLRNGCLLHELPTRAVVELFDLPAGTRRAKLAVLDPPRSLNWTPVLAFAPDGHAVQLRSGDHVQTWSLATPDEPPRAAPEPSAAPPPYAGRTAVNVEPAFHSVMDVATAANADVAAWSDGQGTVWTAGAAGAVDAACTLTALPRGRPHVIALQLDARGETLAVAHHAVPDPTVERWDLRGGARLDAARALAYGGVDIALVGGARAVLETVAGQPARAVLDLSAPALAARAVARLAPDTTDGEWDPRGAVARADGAVAFASARYIPATLAAWDVASGRQLQAVGARDTRVALALSRDERWLAWVRLPLCRGGFHVCEARRNTG
jgi:hypothetical protein